MAYSKLRNSAQARGPTATEETAKGCTEDLIAFIERLSQDPRPPGCKKLKGRQSQYRVCLGDYRVIYSIEEMALVVRIIKVGHRRDIYEEP